MVFALAILLSIGAINALIPILIIIILIAAAAGSTRGFSLFNIFGIATLTGGAATGAARSNLARSGWPFRSLLDPNIRYGGAQRPTNRPSGSPIGGGSIKGNRALAEASKEREAARQQMNLSYARGVAAGQARNPNILTPGGQQGTKAQAPTNPNTLDREATKWSTRLAMLGRFAGSPIAVGASESILNLINRGKEHHKSRKDLKSGRVSPEFAAMGAGILGQKLNIEEESAGLSGHKTGLEQKIREGEAKEPTGYGNPRDRYEARLKAARELQLNRMGVIKAEERQKVLQGAIKKIRDLEEKVSRGEISKEEFAKQFYAVQNQAYGTERFGDNYLFKSFFPFVSDPLYRRNLRSAASEVAASGAALLEGNVKEAKARLKSAGAEFTGMDATSIPMRMWTAAISLGGLASLGGIIPLPGFQKAIYRQVARQMARGGLYTYPYKKPEEKAKEASLLEGEMRIAELQLRGKSFNIDIAALQETPGGLRLINVNWRPRNPEAVSRTIRFNHIFKEEGHLTKEENDARRYRHLAQFIIPYNLNMTSEEASARIKRLERKAREYAAKKQAKRRQGEGPVGGEGTEEGEAE